MRHAALVSALVIALVSLATGPRDAHAAFPDRTIKIIVPFAPGGPIDAIARPLAAAMQEILGATVVVENRSGAGGIIGSETVVSAPPDGYTLLMTTGSHIGNKVFNPTQVRYDPLQGFTPIMGLIETNGIILVARKDIPANSIATLNAYAKSQPNGLTYGHAGIGNISYIGGELLKLQAGMPLSGILSWHSRRPDRSDRRPGRSVFCRHFRCARLHRWGTGEGPCLDRHGTCSCS